jgi:hypothetical protein
LRPFPSPAHAASLLLVLLAPTQRAKGSSGPLRIPQASATVTIIARDYTFEAPDTLPSGPTTFTLLNRGTVKHEVSLMLLRPDQTIADIRRGQTPEDRRNLVEAPIGVLFAPPGQASPAQLTTTLLPGRTYIFACNLRDAVDLPFHFTMGMVDSIYAK